MAWFILLIVAWGALAFGAAYDWARWTLLAGCVVAGAWGLTRQVPHERRGVNGPVLAGLLLVALAVGFQLMPLDRRTLSDWSPATHSFLKEYDLNYALAAASGEREYGARTGVGVPESPSPEAPRDGQPPRSAPRLKHPLSIDPAKTWVGLSLLAGFGFTLLGLARGLGGRDLRILAPGLVALGVVLSIIGVVQKALWNGKVYGFWETINKSVEPFGPFINRNHFAGWMLLALPVGVAYFAALVAKGMVGAKPGWRHRIIWFSTPAASRAVLTGFGVLVMGFALAFTLSRSGVSCFLLAMVLSAFHVLRRQATAAKGRMLLIYLVLVFMTAIAWAGIDAIGARFAAMDWKLAGRAGAWEDAWRIHRSFPWFGTGLNTYGSATVLLQEYEKDLTHYVQAHNDYLQILVEGGWLVTLPALLLLGLFAREVKRRFREGRDDRTGYWLRLGAVTGIVAIAFQEIVEFSLQMPGNAALFTVLCAVAIRKARVKGTKDTRPPRRSGWAEKRRRVPSASASPPASSA